MKSFIRKWKSIIDIYISAYHYIWYNKFQGESLYLIQEAFEVALNATQSTRIREHLLTAQEKPIPIKIGDHQFVDGDGKAMGYIGVALQVYFCWPYKVLFDICKVVWSTDF